MTLAEILQTIEARLAQLQIVGRPLTDAEDAEVSALQRMSSACTSHPLVSPNIDGIRCAWDPREIKPIGRIPTQREVLGVTVISDPSVPPGEVRFFGDPLGLSSLQPDEPERPPSRGKGYYARAYGNVVGPWPSEEQARARLWDYLTSIEHPCTRPDERATIETWYSPE